MAPLVLCPECQRHLRASETTCPFCDADVRDAFSKVLPRAIPTERLGRTALLAFAAANLSVACGGEVNAPEPGPVGLPHYGAPPYDAAFNAGGAGGGSAVTGGMPNTGGMRPGSGGRSFITGGAPGTGGFSTGGVIAFPPYGIPPIPPEPPSAGGRGETGGSPNTSAGGDANTGGDMGIPIYGASPPKP
jgi:hypothetical protein